MKRRVNFVAWWMLGLAGTATGDEFFLEIPGAPEQRSSAVISGRSLSIVDATGSRTDYLRRQELDEPASGFAGYFSAAARQAIRFPARGSGAMQIGSERGGVWTWRTSQMRVVPARERPVDRTPLDPAVRLRVPLEEPRTAAATYATSARQVALLGTRDDAFAAYVDDAGKLQLLIGRGDRWQSQPIESTESFVPGAGLVLLPGRDGELPTIATVTRRGTLAEVRTRSVRILSPPDLRFSPDTQLAVLGDAVLGSGRSIVAVDERGRLWELDGREPRAIERRAGLLAPGTALATLDHDGPAVFAVARSGDLVEYRASRDGVWAAPEWVDDGYLSGGGVAAAGQGGETFVTSIDANGRLRLLRRVGRSWEPENVPFGRVRFPAGAPVALTAGRHGLSLSAVTTDGRWGHWRQRGSWIPSQIADGFPAGGPIAWQPAGDFGVALDRTGRLVAARYVGDRWQCRLCSPGLALALAPQLAERSIVPNPPLEPVRIHLQNRHTEPLVVRVVDVRQGERPTELKIAPGQSAEFQAERDAGATLQEVYLVPNAFGEYVQEMRRWPLPPQSLYQVVVYADRVTSVYFDRTKNRSAVPDSTNRSLTSLGVFALPPGPRLREGSTVDVYDEAVARRNPGAAAAFGP